MRRRAVCLSSLLVAVATVSAAPHHQALDSPADIYAAAVGVYVESGDPARAALGLQAFAKPQFDAAIDGVAIRPDLRLLEAAAVFQVEIAVGVVTQAPATAGAHLEYGEKFVRSLRGLPPSQLRDGREPVLQFAQRWYVAAASVMLMVSDIPRATPFVGRALRMSPPSPSLRLLEGMLSELQAVALHPETWATLSLQARAKRQRTALLLTAENRYRRLVADHPSFVAARIRLGRVESLLDTTEKALANLERAGREAQDPSDRYLAAMFLAAALDTKGDAAGARKAYERALAVEPASQAAAVGLGYLELVAGRPDRAQALAAAFAAHTGPEEADAWWAYKNGGLDLQTLAWLRQRIRR